MYFITRFLVILEGLLNLLMAPDVRQQTFKNKFNFKLLFVLNDLKIYRKLLSTTIIVMFARTFTSRSNKEGLEIYLKYNK